MSLLAIYGYGTCLAIAIFWQVGGDDFTRQYAISCVICGLLWPLTMPIGVAIGIYQGFRGRIP